MPEILINLKVQKGFLNLRISKPQVQLINEAVGVGRKGVILFSRNPAEVKEK